jgi:hypothetical protein
VPRSGPASSRVDGYDRTAASRILAGLAFPGLFGPGGAVDAEALGGQRSVEYRLAPLVPAPGSHLTASQQRYLTSFMRPCPAAAVTSADHRRQPGLPDRPPARLGEHPGRPPRGPAAAREPVPRLADDRVRLPGRRVLPADGRLPPAGRARRGQPGGRRGGLARRGPAAGIRARLRRLTCRRCNRRRCSSHRCSQGCRRSARSRRSCTPRSCTDRRCTPGSRRWWVYSWHSPLVSSAHRAAAFHYLGPNTRAGFPEYPPLVYPIPLEGFTSPCPMPAREQSSCMFSVIGSNSNLSSR